jgi:hypothetical protein
LQKAQRLATIAQTEKPQKRPRRYDGKSKRTLKRHKKHQEVLSKQGFLPIFEFLAHVKHKAEKKERMEQLVARTLEIVPESEESATESEKSVLEELDTEALVSKHVGQVRRREVLIC